MLRIVIVVVVILVYLCLYMDILKKIIYDILHSIKIIPTYDEILPQIFLGDHHMMENARIVREKNIRLVINATDEIPFYRIEDVEEIRVSNFSTHCDLFEKIDHFSLHHQAGILFHCYAGLNRSANILAKYLQYKFEISEQEAQYLIRKKRFFAFYKKVLEL